MPIGRMEDEKPQRSNRSKLYARSLRGYYIDQSAKPGGRWQMSINPVFATIDRLGFQMSCVSLICAWLPDDSSITCGPSNHAALDKLRRLSNLRARGKA